MRRFIPSRTFVRCRSFYLAAALVVSSFLVHRNWCINRVLTG